MDPNANLDQQLALAKDIVTMIDGAGDQGLTDEQKEQVIAHAEELAERVEALDHWLTGLGFLPERWAKGPTEAQKLAVQRAYEEGGRVAVDALATTIRGVLGTHERRG